MVATELDGGIQKMDLLVRVLQSELDGGVECIQVLMELFQRFSPVCPNHQCSGRTVGVLGAGCEGTAVQGPP